MRNVALVILALLLAPAAILGQTDNRVLMLARAQRAPLLETLRELVAIESGSRDIGGLNRLSDVIAGRGPETQHAITNTAQSQERTRMRGANTQPPCAHNSAIRARRRRSRPSQKS